MTRCTEAQIDYRLALTEFAAMLQLGAGALENIASQQQTEPQSHLDELIGIAYRLLQIGEGIAKIAGERNR